MKNAHRHVVTSISAAVLTVSPLLLATSTAHAAPVAANPPINCGQSPACTQNYPRWDAAEDLAAERMLEHTCAGADAVSAACDFPPIGAARRFWPVYAARGVAQRTTVMCDVHDLREEDPEPVPEVEVGEPVQIHDGGGGGGGGGGYGGGSWFVGGFGGGSSEPVGTVTVGPVEQIE